MNKPLFGLTSTWTRVTVRKTSNNNGRSQYVVRCNGQQRTVSYRHDSTNPERTAISEAFGGMDAVKIVAADGKVRGVNVYWAVKR